MNFLRLLSMIFLGASAVSVYAELFIPEKPVVAPIPKASVNYEALANSHQEKVPKDTRAVHLSEAFVIQLNQQYNQTQASALVTKLKKKYPAYSQKISEKQYIILIGPMVMKDKLQKIKSELKLKDRLESKIISLVQSTT